MPIYNDNRLDLGDLAAREHVVYGLRDLVGDDDRYDVIAGTSTAGIPWAAFLADRLRMPMIYVRDKPKAHGLKNQIEGIDAEKDLGERRVLLIEDLISTGGSSAKAVHAIRQANGLIDTCLSIFDYGFAESEEMFSGLRPFEGNQSLRGRCKIESLLDYDTLLEVAASDGYITTDQVDMLQHWRLAPFEWGAKHGYPPVLKNKV
jgi:orotate phosphoribosyltransferase